MKCTTVIDKNIEEEVVIYLHEKREIANKIEQIAIGEDAELIGYSDKSIIRLSPCDIFCVTVEDGRAYALTESEKLQIRQRLYLAEELLGAAFVKINQSCIVNVEKIERFDVSIGGSLLVILKNGYKDYVSRRQVKAVKERIGFKL